MRGLSGEGGRGGRGVSWGLAWNLARRQAERQPILCVNSDAKLQARKRKSKLLADAIRPVEFSIILHLHSSSVHEYVSYRIIGR